MKFRLYCFSEVTVTLGDICIETRVKKRSKNAPLPQQPHQYSSHEGNHWLWLSTIVTPHQPACAAAGARAPTISLHHTYKHHSHNTLITDKGLNLPGLSTVLTVDPGGGFVFVVANTMWHFRKRLKCTIYNAPFVLKHTHLLTVGSGNSQMLRWQALNSTMPFEMFASGECSCKSLLRIIWSH